MQSNHVAQTRCREFEDSEEETCFGSHLKQMCLHGIVSHFQTTRGLSVGGTPRQFRLVRTLV